MRDANLLRQIRPDLLDDPLQFVHGGGNEAWLANFQADGFERVSDWYWRLWRYSYPEQLMVETTLEAQGRRLGEWVVEAFRTLESVAPPN